MIKWDYSDYTIFVSYTVALHDTKLAKVMTLLAAHTFYTFEQM